MRPPADPGSGAPPEGRYSNCFKVGYNAFEVLLDFGQRYAEAAVEHFHTRIILTPGHAKLLLESLQEAIQDYERRFGETGNKPGG